MPAGFLVARYEGDGDPSGFKQVNDTFGHVGGDVVLRHVSEVLSDVLEPDDFAARISGDEFVAVLTNLPNSAAASALARSIIKRLSTSIEINHDLATIGASIGITAIPEEYDGAFDVLLVEADLALYDAKQAGRGRVRVFSPEMQEREALSQQLIRDIDPAVQAEEFVLFFQVQVDCATGAVQGAEVLGRWEHPQLGQVGPAQFLYVAECARLVKKVDRCIYAKALDHFADWHRAGVAPPYLSFNITGRKLVRDGFVEEFTRQVHARGLSRTQIVFEMVETILLPGNMKTFERPRWPCMMQAGPIPFPKGRKISG